MTTMREMIREQNRLTRMRQGQEVGEYVDIPSIPGARVLIVPLIERDMTQGMEYAASKGEILPENFSGAQVRTRFSVHHDLWCACREPGDIEQRVFDTPEAVSEQLDPADIDYLNMHLAALMNFASPSLDGMTEEDLDFLEASWKAISLRELTGRQWAAAKVSLSILLPEQLQGKLRGSTSIDGLTPTSTSDESTSDALAS